MEWLRRKERIAWELEQLRAGGFSFEEPTITDHVVTVPVVVEIGSELHRLEVDFFELYPYFRFEVRAPSLALDHHQHPFGKNLCLIPRATAHWDVNQSLAGALREQLPKVLAADRAGATKEAIEVEDRQAEPASTYFPSEPNSAILIDSDWILPPELWVGRITLMRDPASRNAPFCGAVTELSSIRNEIRLTAPRHFPRGGDRVEGFLVRLDAPIYEQDPAKLYERVRREHLPRARDNGKTTVLALLFPEEHRWRDASGLGWLFIVKERGKGVYFVRAERAGENDLRSRAPELAQLASHAVAHFGLGCIGAISAIEFAKAGVGALRLLDPDSVDAGTILRWYLGLPIVGRRKVEVVRDFITSHYPLTSAIGVVGRIGSTAGERVAIAKMVEGASVIYDATAEPGVSYFLADLARHTGIPYIGVSGTQGGWGGIVARLLPHHGTGCWYCLERAKEVGLVPVAPADESGTVQPIGCADPTFTGAGFDLATIALTGVRTAVATMLDGVAGYPAAPSDVTVISLRDAHGRLIQPQFSGVSLGPYPDCPACGSGSR